MKKIWQEFLNNFDYFMYGMIVGAIVGIIILEILNSGL